jgi:hypothetical protein
MAQKLRSDDRLGRFGRGLEIRVEHIANGL